MLKHAQIFRRVPLSLAFAITALFAFAPMTLAATHGQGLSPSLVGPKQHYLALGDSVAFGYQPNGDFTHGYVNDLFQILQSEGTKDVTNLGCPGESTTTFINGGCPFSPGTPAQLATAVAFLQAHAGKVSPVTLDIGANDVFRNITVTESGCTVDTNQFNADLATLDSNLTGTILPALLGALTVDGRVTGSIVMMNYYDPLQNICPASVAFFQTVNQHLAADISGFGSIVDVFDAFGGTTIPNPNICTLTWACTPPPLGPDVHPTNQGYSIIADTFAAALPPD
jgi:lysophospholipase L1-like esterase